MILLILVGGGERLIFSQDFALNPMFVLHNHICLWTESSQIEVETKFCLKIMITQIMEYSLIISF